MKSKKEKGDIGLAKVIASLIENGVHVSIPLSEHLKYDIVVEIGGICKTLQARYCAPKNGGLHVKLKSSWSNKKGNHIVKRKQGDFDYLGIYCPSNDQCYYLSDKDFINSTQINLRLEKSSSINQKESRLAEDHISFNKIWKSTQVAQGEGLLNL